MTSRPFRPSDGCRQVSPSPSASGAALRAGSAALACFRTLLAVLPARTPSDRTCFQRLAFWLADEVEAGRFTSAIFARVLSLAEESREGQARNPHAVFMARVRKDLGYLATRAARPGGRAGKDAGCTPGEKGGRV